MTRSPLQGVGVLRPLLDWKLCDLQRCRSPPLRVAILLTTTQYDIYNILIYIYIYYIYIYIIYIYIYYIINYIYILYNIYIYITTRSPQLVTPPPDRPQSCTLFFQTSAAVVWAAAFLRPWFRSRETKWWGHVGETPIGFFSPLLNWVVDQPLLDDHLLLGFYVLTIHLCGR